LPLYPYRCTSCGYRFEKIQKVSAEPEKECPKCGGALERQLTAPGLQFKGAGWYVNDYAAKSSSSSESTSAEAGAGDKKPAKETGTDSKSASSGADSTASSTPAASSVTKD
jgi:putative FmdB family regulatory protein